MPSFENDLKWGWSEVMKRYILEKTEKLNGEDFERFPKNWLLIYDNIPEPALEDGVAINYLIEFTKSYFQDALQLGEKYNAVFIMTYQEFIVIDPNGTGRTEIVDLWQNYRT